MSGSLNSSKSKKGSKKLSTGVLENYKSPPTLISIAREAEEEEARETKTTLKKERAVSTSYEFKAAATYTDFLLLTGLQKKLMKIVIDTHATLGLVGEEPCPLDTWELKDQLGKSANQIGNALYRLQKKGFLVILASTRNGGRTVSVASSLFLKKH